MKIDTTDTLRVVQNKNAESEAYSRQLHIWLGAGSAGGAISMASLAASLRDPAYVFHFLTPSFWSFLVGVVAAGSSLFFLALRADEQGEHFATSHNRDQINEAIRAMPEVIASPKRLADEANQARNELIRQSHEKHARAERAWARSLRYKVAWAASLTISALAFVLGFAWPLAQLSFFGAKLLP
ncbi:hypothetical protein LB523_28170 [Mesorhizobium sp. ESP-6-4]|uniref:hypothetical protein n=1 Tax=Mesorhizobium sp. ESP-6-4 TaxID=2876624 RepID=UPI001CCEF0E4|nr:hypothetical protein [Mesorhizobium sp. ESP-6-4]MBZ9662932.1 hypothetical protein [Mesorhizobium sp. ESP-6-4]